MVYSSCVRVLRVQEELLFVSKDRSKSAKASWSDPQKRAARIAAITVAMNQPKTRAKLKRFQSSARAKAAQSARVKHNWKNPDYRARQHESRCAAHGTPEARAVKAVQTKEQWASGQRDRVSISNQMKVHWKDEVYRAKVLTTSVPRIKQQARKNWESPKARKKMLTHLKTFSKTLEARQANSERTKALWDDPVYRAKMIKARKASYTEERSKRTTATRLANNPDIEPWNKGKTKHTDSRLAKISKQLAGIIPDYGKYRAWYRGQNGDIRMRSKWEVAYAEYLDCSSVAWKYEPKKFYVGAGRWCGESYTPDFYLPKTKEYIEVKGRLTLENRLKMSTFRLLFSAIKLRVLHSKDLIALGILTAQGHAVLRGAM